MDEKNNDLLAAFAKDTTAAGKAVAELLQDPTPEAAKALLDRLPSLLPDDPETAAVIAEAMAAEFGDQIVKNKTDAQGNEHDNGNGQFTEKGAGGGDIHTPDEEKRIAEYKGSTDKTAIAWLDNIMSLDEKSQKEEFFKFGSSDAKMSSDIEKVTGIKTEGWPIKMQGNHAVHIIQRHGPTGQHDHSMADKNDFGRIGFAVSHYDKIVKIDDNNGYRDSHNQPAKQIEFRTRIDGTMAVQTVVPDTKKKTLFITSARIEKRKDEHL